MTRIYLLDAGGVFIGTLEQFCDCFFSNATDELIADFAISKGYKIEVIDTNNPTEWISNYINMCIGG